MQPETWHEIGSETPPCIRHERNWVSRDQQKDPLLSQQAKGQLEAFCGEQSFLCCISQGSYFCCRGMSFFIFIVHGPSSLSSLPLHPAPTVPQVFTTLLTICIVHGLYIYWHVFSIPKDTCNSYGTFCRLKTRQTLQFRL